MASIGQFKMVKFYEYTNSKSLEGDNVETEVLRIKTYAEVTDTGGSRGDNRGQSNLSGGKTFKIRQNGNRTINADWKIKYFGKIYTITHIERINEKRLNWLINAQG